MSRNVMIRGGSRFRDALRASFGATEVTSRIDYVELPSGTAHELTRAFYTKVFGWEFTNYGPTYSATSNGTTDLGLQGDPAEALATVLPVIRADNLESALNAVVKAGGVIAKPIFSFPGGRRFH